MLPIDTCLKEFAKPMPTCPATADGMVLFEAMGGGADLEGGRHFHDCVVLLNPQSQPVGLVALHRLLPALIAQGLVGKKSQSRKGRRASSSNPTDQELGNGIIESILVRPGSLPMEQFLLTWDLDSPVHCAIVDDRGEWLGLLDRDRLLRWLTRHAYPRSAKAAQQTALVAGQEASAIKRQKTSKQHATRLAQQFLWQKEELEQKVKTQQETIQRLTEYQRKLSAATSVQTPFARVSATRAAMFNPLNPLPELLEQLPLPLMLQTEDGCILAQNAVWRQLTALWVNEVEVGQEVALLLETTVPDSPRFQRGHRSNAIALPQTEVAQTQPAQLTATAPPDAPSAEPLPGAIAPSLPALSLCHIGSKPNTCICVCPLTDGQEQVLQFIKIPVGRLTPQSDASHTLWLILAQDITEQQQLARELTAKNVDLMHLNRLKDEFLACISHELRTPLTAVLGLSSLLKDQSLGEMTQRQVHYAQLIYQSGRHLMAVVNDILDLTRMETGQLELVSEPVKIVTVCNRAFEQAKQLRQIDKQQTPPADHPFSPFVLEVEPGLDLLVADEQRLRQMLIHLLTNALKFTEPENPIGLKVNRWGGWIAFTVWDNGIGIPADKQHLIFQKFQQLENPLTRRFEGTGLGLVLTQRLARLHGGDVSFISREGQGSQFTILLPPSPPDSAAIAPDNAPTPPHYPGGRVSLSTPSQMAAEVAEEQLRQHLVLVVEAAPTFIETLTEQLTGLGYRVVIARSGTEALEKARRLQPCLIFLNPVLPLLSGWDVLTLLKSSAETRQIPVAVTATQVDEAHSHRTYADGWLSLPVQTRALRQTLRQLVTDLAEPIAPPASSSGLTILSLSPGAWNDQQAPPATNLTPLLHAHHYHVLEADDLEQAELLARVWKPNVVLLNGMLIDPPAYFQQFSQHTFLASLPLVTVTPEATQAANQVLGLLVFPCLASLTPSEVDTGEVSALLQVIQVAAGYTWRPSILALDVATLPASFDSTETQTTAGEASGNFLKESEWLQALTQYLQTAGFCGLVGRSWQEVLHQVQSHRVDLLLICWTHAAVEPALQEMLTALQQIEAKPPILVLDHRDRQTPQQSTAEKLPDVLQQLATRILPPSLPMESLLAQIHQLLKG